MAKNNLDLQDIIKAVSALTKNNETEKKTAFSDEYAFAQVLEILIENAGWLYFCPWYDEESSPKFVSGSDYQDIDEFKKNPSIQFAYKYLGNDDMPTRHFGAVNNAKEEAKEKMKKYLDYTACEMKSPAKEARKAS